MILLDSIEIPVVSGKATIELHHGDLTRMQPADAVDALVVSAFPDDYEPTPQSLIGALATQGLSIADLAATKAVDLRTAFSCWLSQPILKRLPGLEFDRILCFESVKAGSAASHVGDIFRALAPFMADSSPIRSIAMPLLTTGDQGYAMEDLLPALLDAACHWIRNGLPLQCVKIVVRSAETALAALALFRTFKEALPREVVAAEVTRDVFISYSRHDGEAASAIRDELQSHGLSVYFDQQSIDVGVAWQQHIYAAVESCSAMLALFSPSYVASRVCQEEFNMALFRSRREARQILFPVYWITADLPVYMEMINYLDCRESCRHRIVAVCAALRKRV